MILKYSMVAVVAGSVAIIPADEVQADAGDFIAGAIIGGIVGANAKKQRRTTRSTRRTTRSTRSRIPSTQEGRTIQASLNYFGFDAGAVDGQLGKKSRNAISQFQGYLGYPVTGKLTPFELNLLTSSYNRAQAGGQSTLTAAAATPDGVRGLLRTYRAEMAGQGSTTTTVATTAPVTTTATQVPQIPVTTAAAPAATGALPSFMGAGTQASLTSHCNQVSLITNTSGGFVTLANMTDPNTALNEQFCLARTYAIARSEELVAKIPGFTPDQIAAQCEGFGPAMKEHVTALGMVPQAEVVSKVTGFVQSTGMAPAQLAGTAKICMGVGYRRDNMDVAVGSALILYTLGEPVYGELMGHHLAQGFGPAKRVDLAAPWFASAISALDNGVQPVFNPGQPERKELVRQASLRLNGAPALPVLPQVQPASSVPTFSISE